MMFHDLAVWNERKNGKKKPFCCDVSEVYFCLLLLADSVSVRILWSLYLYFIYALEYISQNLAQN